jgi:hypothetical protein
LCFSATDKTSKNSHFLLSCNPIPSLLSMTITEFN